MKNSFGGSRFAAPEKVTSCGCFVHRTLQTGEHQVLLVRPASDRDVWGLPKGRSEKGEDSIATARREVLEETGLEVTIGDSLPIAHRNSRFEEKTLFTFMARPASADRPYPADGTNVAVQWFAFDKLPALHAYQVSVIAAGIELVKARSGQPHT